MKKNIEKIVKRPAERGMVGDGFPVYHYFPGGPVSMHRMSPFLLLDYAAESNFAPSEYARGVGAHPHKGFETVTIAIKGAVEHHDSAGNHGVIYPGDVQWMTAGSGLLHKEYHEKEFSRNGGSFEMIQLWVNLPARFKKEAPHYQSIKADQIGVYELPDNGGTVKVIAGSWHDVQGPAKTYTPINLFQVDMNEGGIFNGTVEEGHTLSVLVMEGETTMQGKRIEPQSLVVFETSGTVFSIRADSKARLLFMSGEPLNEPIASYGPFVMNTQAELMETFEEFREGKFGELN